MLGWRDATDADGDLLRRLDASLCGWLDLVASLSDEQRRSLLVMQSRAREAAYRAAWPGARCLIVERDGGEAIGRMWLAQSAGATTLLDITVLPEQRGRGAGTACLQHLVADARARRVPVRLQVEPSNPAKRLYERLGFVAGAVQGFHLEMTWQVDDPIPLKETADEQA